jgi:aryl-alcohol dehydrogenase-like predicted oxidoreductase
MGDTPIETKAFGRTEATVTCVGLGGEGVLRTTGKKEDARAVVRGAISRGITYFDSARVYADSERYLGSVWKESPELRAGIFQASKSASRDREGAEKDLKETLSRLNVDYLDLWQIHDIRTAGELAQIGGPGGAIEAFTAAKKEGRVRFIGVTGHSDPAVLTLAVETLPVDSVMMPVNPAEGVLGGFLTETLPAAKARGMAVIGMKIMGAGHYIVPRLEVTADLLIRYALDQGISVAIVGCSNPAEVEILARMGRSYAPLTETERDDLLEKFRLNAGRLAYYRAPGSV